jgi:hypothetical protein
MPLESIRDWQLIDVDSGVDIAERVRSYYIPKFADWRNEASFAAAFDRLLRDLRDSEAADSASIIRARQL